MTKFILFLLLLISINATSQTTTDQAIAICDSILKSKVSDGVYQYFSLSEGSYYTYTGKHHREQSGKFLNKRKLPKSFTTLNFLYHFDYPDLKGVIGGLWLIVDKDFRLVNTLDFDFIPQFVVDNKASKFISSDTVIVIAKANFIKKGLEITTPELSYNDKLRQYEYTVYNKLTKTLNQAGNDSGEMEIIKINALTGKIELVDKGYYGLIIR